MYIIGLKRTLQILELEDNYRALELDELYWFIERKGNGKCRENICVMTMVSPMPRQIVGFDAAKDKAPERIQKMVDQAPPGERYFSDGCLGYRDIVYPGKYKQNVHNKSNTFTAEDVNSDLRHSIPVPARRSKCFACKLGTLKAVLGVFVRAYNLFGKAKYQYRLGHRTGELPLSSLRFFFNNTIGRSQSRFFLDTQLSL